MEHLRITCPHCNYSRTIPRDKAPSRSVTATCPRCKEQFQFDPVTAEPVRQEAATIAPPRPESASAPPPPFTPSPPAPRRELRGIGELLADAWSIFQRRFGTLIVVYLATLLVVFVPMFAGTALAMAIRSFSEVAAALCMVLGMAGSAVAFCWGWGACVAASLDDSVDFRAAFARGREKLLPFALVTVLASFVICGGFLLFIVPGVIFVVWFFFATFIVFDEDTGGMSALLKSQAYVRGRWFDVFLRLVVLWVLSVILGSIPFVGPLLSLLAAPYMLLYQALLFKDLKEVAGPVELPSSSRDRMKWIWIALIGYLLIPALILAVAGGALYNTVAPLLQGAVPSFSTPLTSPNADSPLPPASVAPGAERGGSGPPVSASPAEQSRYPEDVHLFIYVVNYSGRVKANGKVVREFGTVPDMQYNYNEGGEKLLFGQNTFTVEFDPLQNPEAKLSPRIHIRVSTRQGAERTLLGEWEIEEKAPGQKTMTVDIPSA